MRRRDRESVLYENEGHILSAKDRVLHENEDRVLGRRDVPACLLPGVLAALVLVPPRRARGRESVAAELALVWLHSLVRVHVVCNAG